MPTRAQVCTWIAAAGLLVPSVATGQGLNEHESDEPAHEDSLLRPHVPYRFGRVADL